MSLETFTSTNRQLVASLAKQCLPKYQPNVFDGDVAIFRKLKKQAQMTTAKATLTQTEGRRPRWTFLQRKIMGRYLQRNYFYRAGGQVECSRLGMEVSPFNVWKYQRGQIRTKSNKYKGKAKSPLILISSFSQRV